MLSAESLRALLSALATGDADRAANVVATADGLDDATRASLAAVLEEVDGASATARRIGDVLRSLGADRNMVNECYRVAFYAGDAWKELASNPLFAYFAANRAGQPLDKWVHYFPIYERHMAGYRGTAARVLEIGVYRGGGLDLLRHYLGPEAYLAGVDIDKAAERAVRGRHPVELGDQADPDFLTAVSERHGPFDLVIDDGGHTMRQQIVSVETLFPLLAEGGIYLVEDCNTSYWPEYAAEGEDTTFIGWLKERVDDLHAYHHSRDDVLADPWQTALAAMHLYDSVAVLERTRRFAPFSEIAGTAEFVNHTRDAVADDLALVANRDRAIGQAEDEARMLRGELLHANDELAHARNQLHRTWGEIGQMRRSRSWRITEPLRRVTGFLRGR